MRKMILLLLCFISFEYTFACINEYRTLLTGEVVSKEKTRGVIWNKDIDTLELRSNSEGLLALYKSNGSLEAYSDYAAVLIYLDEYTKAKAIY